MKHKTLFRLMLKAVGILIVASGAQHTFSQAVYLLYLLFQPGGVPGLAGRDWINLVGFAGSALTTAFGLYLFFGGKWLVDKAIPSNRPYCHECGYDLTGAARNRCPECDTPFRPEDVMPMPADEEPIGRESE